MQNYLIPDDPQAFPVVPVVVGVGVTSVVFSLLIVAAVYTRRKRQATSVAPQS